MSLNKGLYSTYYFVYKCPETLVPLHPILQPLDDSCKCRHGLISIPSSFPPLPLLLFLLYLFFLFANVAPASGHVYGAPKEKVTHLHFYFHEIYGGPNTTTITVVNPPGNNSFNNFGSIGVGDNMLREGPNPSSKLIGRAQELAVQASLESPAYLSAFNFVFTAGEHNGSSISIFGRAVLTETMERGIIGGTGKFRMARGYTISRLIRRTGTTEIVLVVEYDAYIFHY